MYRGHTIGVVVPAYNEEGLIGTVIETMPAYVDRVYVIDDCSTDGTWGEIRRYAERENERARQRGPVRVDESLEPVRSAVDGDRVQIQMDGGLVFDPRVRSIHHERNRGVGGAIKTGYTRALEDGTDVTAVMGGDGQMDPDILHKFLDPIVEDEADYAKGNRLLYREYRAAMPRFRFVGNSILTFLTKIASGYWKTMDPQNGYTAISRDALDSVGVRDMYEYYGYCNDLLVKLNANGCRVADVAMPAKYDEAESSISYPTYIRKVSVMLLKNFLWRINVTYLVLDFHPLALFYYLGAGTAALGLLGGIWTLYTAFAAGGELFLDVMASVVVAFLGTLCLLFAMVFDMRANEDREIQICD